MSAPVRASALPLSGCSSSPTSAAFAREELAAEDDVDGHGAEFGHL
jgi:hypothetical protein